ncbi:MAG: hypothetical protein JWP91_2700 [Fibrobacteres bacterium]|nr:hypothetical protein [Fibrobacterota bacterium]
MIRASLLVSLVLLAGCGAISHTPVEKEKNVAQNPDELGLIDEEYWSDPYKTLAEIQSPLVRAGKEVLLVGAPSKVVLGNHDTLPVLVIRTAPLDRMARRGFRKQAVLTAVDLGTDSAFAYMAMESERKESPTYDGPPLEGIGGEAFTLDAGRQLGLPWTPGRYLIGVLLQDQASNRVRVDLKKGNYEDPAVTGFLKEHDRNLEPPSPFPVPALQTDGASGQRKPVFPFYSAWAQSPPLPEGLSLVMAADRVIPKTGNTAPACVLRGSFRLTILRRHFVKQAPIHDPAIRTHTAVVPITVMLTGSEVAAPILIPLRVPVYDAVDKDADSATVTGHFTVDLAKLKPITGTDQTYFIYAFSGEAMAGPVPMALVKP